MADEVELIITGAPVYTVDGDDPLGRGPSGRAVAARRRLAHGRLPRRRPTRRPARPPRARPAGVAGEPRRPLWLGQRARARARRRHRRDHRPPERAAGARPARRAHQRAARGGNAPGRAGRAAALRRRAGPRWPPPRPTCTASASAPGRTRGCCRHSSTPTAPPRRPGSSPPGWLPRSSGSRRPTSPCSTATCSTLGRPGRRRQGPRHLRRGRGRPRHEGPEITTPKHSTSGGATEYTCLRNPVSRDQAGRASTMCMELGVWMTLPSLKPAPSNRSRTTSGNSREISPARRSNLR